MSKIRIKYIPTDLPKGSNSFWNYRVIRHLANPKSKFPEEWVGIHEVHYRKSKGEWIVSVWSQSPVGVTGETLAEVKNALVLYNAAVKESTIIVDCESHIVGEDTPLAMI